jgi:hypothetical protein
MGWEVLQRQRLARAEEIAVLGEHHIVRQRELIAKLERKGVDTAEANRLLATFEALQATHLAERDRLRGELDGPFWWQARPPSSISW